MDEYRNSLEEWEFSMPAPESEFSRPASDAELTPPEPELFAETPPREPEPSGDGQKTGKVRRLIRGVVTVAAAATLVAAAKPAPAPRAPLEVVDVESHIEISLAAVRPEEPELLRFEYLDYSSLYEEDFTVHKNEGFSYYLVSPEGEETELTVTKDPVFYRPAYCPEGTRVAEAVYSRTPGENDYFSLNIGSQVYDADIGPYEEGSLLKVVCTYEADGVLKRMTSTREIFLMPKQEELSATVEVISVADGVSGVSFTAVLHPQEGEDFEYVFGSKAFGQLNLCTRWYDADGVFLGEGWAFAVREDWGFPLTEAYVYEGDYYFVYEGPVRSSVTNSDAVYYTLELVITEESTGWHYLFETDLIPLPSLVSSIFGKLG